MKSAAKGTMVVFFGMVSSIRLWFSTKLIIVRYTTKEEPGLYSLTGAITGIFVLLTNLDLQKGVSRYISVYLGEGAKG